MKNFIMLHLLFYPVWFFTYEKIERRVYLVAVPRTALGKRLEYN